MLIRMAWLVAFCVMLTSCGTSAEARDLEAARDAWAERNLSTYRLTYTYQVSLGAGKEIVVDVVDGVGVVVAWDGRTDRIPALESQPRTVEELHDVVDDVIASSPDSFLLDFDQRGVPVQVSVNPSGFDDDGYSYTSVSIEPLP